MGTEDASPVAELGGCLFTFLTVGFLYIVVPPIYHHVLIPLFKTVVLFCRMSWSIWLLLIVGVIGYKAAGEDTPSHKVVRKILLPASLGLSLVLVYALVSSVLLNWTVPSFTRDFELWLLRVRASIYELFHWPLPAFIVVIVSLTLADVLLKTHRFLKAYMLLKKGTTFLLIVLTTAGSFTLFSLKPLDTVASDRRRMEVKKIELSLRRSWQLVGEYLSIQYLIMELESATSEEVEKWYVTFNDINESGVASYYPRSRYGRSRDPAIIDVRTEVTQDLARASIESDAKGLEAAVDAFSDNHQPVDTSAQKTPKSLADWQRLDESALRAKKTESQLEETVRPVREGAVILFKKLIMEVSPSLEGISEVYIKACISEVATRVFAVLEKKLDVKTQRPVDISSNALQSKFEATRKLETMHPIDLLSGLKGDLVWVRGRTRVEVQRRVDMERSRIRAEEIRTEEIRRAARRVARR